VYQADRNMDNATVVVDAFDTQIELQQVGWSTLGSIGVETSVQGSYLNFNFVGAFRLQLQIFPLTI
jgi:hypothetical protein